MNSNLTINGKSVTVCLEELTKAPEKLKETYRGFDYIPVEAFYQRLWDVFGKDNVIITQPSTTQPVYNQLHSGQVTCSVYVEVDILFDNGQTFRKVGSWGETELIYSDKSGTFDGLGNVCDIASTRALKNALKKLDIFGVYSSREDNSKSNAKPKATASVTKEKPKTRRGARGRFSLKGIEPIVEIRKDANTQLPVYAWKCRNEAGEILWFIVPVDRDEN